MGFKKGKSPQHDVEKNLTSFADKQNRVLPPLSSLRAFEAAARHRNFSRAAEELNVTTSAISHQLRTLEDWLDTPLFVRNRRPIRLTEAGLIYSRGIALAFDQISKTTLGVLTDGRRAVLTVSTMDSLATNWLVPRLARFREQNEWLDVRVATGDRFVDLSREGVDVAIRYGDGQWKGVVSELLFEDKVVAVCSPGLLNAGADEQFRPELYTLIHDGAKPGWTEWFQSQGQTDLIGSASSIYFNHTYLALQAAIGGEGVALASEVLVSDSIVQGHLVNATMNFLMGTGAYYLVTSPEGGDQSRVRLFRDWLMTERLMTLAC